MGGWRLRWRRAAAFRCLRRWRGCDSGSGRRPHWGRSRSPRGRWTQHLQMAVVAAPWGTGPRPGPRSLRGWGTQAQAGDLGGSVFSSQLPPHLPRGPPPCISSAEPALCPRLFQIRELGSGSRALWALPPTPGAQGSGGAGQGLVWGGMWGRGCQGGGITALVLRGWSSSARRTPAHPHLLGLSAPADTRNPHKEAGGHGSSITILRGGTHYPILQEFPSGLRGDKSG